MRVDCREALVANTTSGCDSEEKHGKRTDWSLTVGGETYRSWSGSCRLLYGGYSCLERRRSNTSKSDEPPHRFMALPCISGSGLGSCTYRRTFPQPSGAPISVSPGGGIRRESSARWGAVDVSWAPTWFAAKDEFLKNSPLSPVAPVGVA